MDLFDDSYLVVLFGVLKEVKASVNPLVRVLQNPWVVDRVPLRGESFSEGGGGY